MVGSGPNNMASLKRKCWLRAESRGAQLVLSTQCSADRLPALERLLSSWEGIVVAAVLLEHCGAGTCCTGVGNQEKSWDLHECAKKCKEEHSSMLGAGVVLTDTAAAAYVATCMRPRAKTPYRVACAHWRTRPRSNMCTCERLYIQAHAVACERQRAQAHARIHASTNAERAPTLTLHTYSRTKDCSHAHLRTRASTRASMRKHEAPSCVAGNEQLRGDVGLEAAARALHARASPRLELLLFSRRAPSRDASRGAVPPQQHLCESAALVYPINALRNLSLSAASACAPLVWLLDVDCVPSAAAYAALVGTPERAAALRRLCCDDGAALVVPCIEACCKGQHRQFPAGAASLESAPSSASSPTLSATAIPGRTAAFSVSEAQAALREGRAQPFMATRWPAGHRATRFDLWVQAGAQAQSSARGWSKQGGSHSAGGEDDSGLNGGGDGDKDGGVGGGQGVEGRTVRACDGMGAAGASGSLFIGPLAFESLFEPYVIVSCALCPRFDEGLCGYGRNKALHALQLYHCGAEFWASSDVCLLHVEHAPSLAFALSVGPTATHAGKQLLQLNKRRYSLAAAEMAATCSAAPPSLPLPREQSQAREQPRRLWQHPLSSQFGSGHACLSWLACTPPEAVAAAGVAAASGHERFLAQIYSRWMHFAPPLIKAVDLVLSDSEVVRSGRSGHNAHAGLPQDGVKGLRSAEAAAGAVWLVTHLSVDRLDRLEAQLRAWRPGPVAAAVWVGNDRRAAAAARRFAMRFAAVAGAADASVNGAAASDDADAAATQNQMEEAQMLPQPPQAREHGRVEQRARRQLRS
eukprot:6182251-Pleurochrysis_carterae.AAC.1